MKGRPGCDFSFSGLKTAVARWVESCQDAGREAKATTATGQSTP